MKKLKKKIIGTNPKLMTAIILQSTPNIWKDNFSPCY